MKKNAMMICMALILSASCTEQEDMLPTNLVQYEVECAHCFVEFPDNYFQKDIVVSGKMVYEFHNTTLEEAFIRITKSAHMGAIPVTASISAGGQVLESWSGDLEWDDVTITAALK